MNRLLLALILAIQCVSALAGSDGYVCTVRSFHRLGDAGTLSTEPKDPIVGQEFTVDRSTGKILGRYISNSSFKTEVLDAGSKTQSFKTIAKSHAGFLHVIYYQVLEFAEGSRKPFVLMDGSLIYAGTCT